MNFNSSSLDGTSIKHTIVKKANAQVVAISSVAAALLIFTLFAGGALISRISYQNEVIDRRAKANDQLEQNVDSVASLVTSYTTFNNSAESIIGTADNNSKVVLDSLPSKYDFPALVSSIEGLVKESSLIVQSITGTDEEATAVQSSLDPSPIPIEFTITAKGNYQNIQDLVKNMQRSIRPFKINEISLSGKDNDLSVQVEGETYYQPSKELGITEEVVEVD